MIVCSAANVELHTMWFDVLHVSCGDGARDWVSTSGSGEWQHGGEV